MMLSLKVVDARPMKETDSREVQWVPDALPNHPPSRISEDTDLKGDCGSNLAPAGCATRRALEVFRLWDQRKQQTGERGG